MGARAAAARQEAGWHEVRARLAVALGVAAAYLVCGELAQLMALPPGYASPVWPAAGVAVVAAVLAGRAGIAGVMLGSFLLNFHLATETTFPPLSTGALLAAFIAVGAGAQAACAAWLCRRFLGHGNPIEQSYNVPALILLTGPVASLVNTAWAPAWLVLLGRVPAGEAYRDALTWWVGDSIGVMLVAPVLFCWDARRYFGGAREWAAFLTPLVFGTIAVVVLFVQAERASRFRMEAAFDERAEYIASSIVLELDRAEAYTESIARAFGAIPAIDRDAFRVMVSPWVEANPGIEAFLWAPYVRADELPAFERSLHDEGVVDFRLRPVPGGRAEPAGFHAPVLDIEPFATAKGMVGIDLATEPTRLAALRAARDTGRVVASEPVPLVLASEEHGILLVAAAYGGVKPPATELGRALAVRGFAIGFVRLEPLVREAQARSRESDLIVRVLQRGDRRLLAGPRTLDPYAARWQGDTSVGGLGLALEVATPGPAPRAWTGWTVLSVGLASTGLLVAFVLDLRAQAVRVARLVAERTRELALANDALTRSNLEHQRFAYVASHDLREPLRTIASYGELLVRDAAPRLAPGERGYLERIVAAARRMQGLVADLLSLTRLDSRVEPFKDFCLDRAVQAALDDLATVIAETGATVIVGPLPSVRCDPIQMVQLFSNLISNALKFRRTDVRPVVEVEGRVVDGGVEVSVRDNGIGIEERHFQRIFDLFQRLNPEAAYPGHGVGLATCRRIMERHHGAIWVESTPGVGSAFHVRFEVAP